MSRAVLGSWLFALVGCAAAATTPQSTTGASQRAGSATAPSADVAVELLAQLPQGADRCVFARPSRVSAAQRALLSRVVQAEALAWLPELDVLAYASVERADRNGPSARVSVLALGMSDDAARAVLERRSGVALDWSSADTACAGAGCPVHARFIAPQRLRLEHGAFQAARDAGVETLCRQAAQSAPDALEWSAASESAARAVDMTGLPLGTTSDLRATADGVRVLRVDQLASELEAEAALQEQAAPGLLSGASLAALGQARSERRGDSLYTEVDVAWEDLSLAQDDDARMQAADHAADALAAVRPDLDATPRDRDALFGTVGYLLDNARRSGEPTRSRELQAARTLLESALTRDADDERSALVLCELLVAELRAAEPALQLVQRFVARHSASEPLLACGRSATALISGDTHDKARDKAH